MKALALLLTLALALFAAGCGPVASVDGLSSSALGGADDDDDENEEDIPLSEVPQNVMDAATEAVPGFVAETAEREIENSVTVYCLERTANGEPMEIGVSEAGDVLEIETGDDD